MITYHKIQTVFLRDPDTKFKTLLDGQFAKPEFDWLANNEWIATEKIDGTNIRVMFDGQKVFCNGKTDNAQIHGDLLKYLYEHFTVERMKAQFGDEPTDVCLYGEGYGGGIQSGGYYQMDKRFILFDVLVGGVWLERQNVEDVSAGVECPIVPILHRGPLLEAVEMVRNGFDSTIAKERHVAEGLIMKPATELFNRRGERVITKIKHADFGMVQSAAR